MLKRTAVVAAGLALVLLVALVSGWLLSDPESSGRKGRQAQRLAAELLGKDASPELGSADDVLRYVRGQRANAGLVSYALDGAGRPSEPAVRHRELDPAPVASAIKIIHLAAYATAVGAGRLDPAERVGLGAWEAYVVPGTDGGAHEAALARLTKLGRTDTVTLDQLVSAMIEESDNAAADYLRERLGEPALITAARLAGGPAPAHISSLNGQILRGFGHCGTVPADRCLREYQAATGEARARLAPERLPGYADQAAWAETTTPVAPATLAALLAAIASDRYVSPEVSAIARRHLEWQTREGPLTGRVKRLGAKGGSLPGVLAEASYAVAADGGIRVTVLSLRAMPERAWTSALESYALQRFTLRPADDPAYLTKVRADLD